MTIPLREVLLLVIIMLQLDYTEAWRIGGGDGFIMTPSLPNFNINQSEPLFYLYDDDVGVSHKRFPSNVDSTNNNNWNLSPRIVNGNQVSPPQKYEFMALIYTVSNNAAYFICGGSLISKNTVLCAAHCADSASGVILGVHDMTQIESDGLYSEWFDIVEIEVHPDYDNLVPPKNDVALFRLDGVSAFDPITLDDGSLNLAYDDVNLGNGEDLINIGWGITETGSISAVLKEAEFDYISNGICQTAWGSNIQDDQLCIYRQDVSSCNGDSGGPLFLQSGNEYVQVGIVSWGASSCYWGYPSVFARVSYAYTWITGVASSWENLITTVSPTRNPTKKPTKSPTRKPTRNPTKKPTKSPTRKPTRNPTKKPTKSPTRNPTKSPVNIPTRYPTTSPMTSPTKRPTKIPTISPTRVPIASPTQTPTRAPTNSPSRVPVSSPTGNQTREPTELPIVTSKYPSTNPHPTSNPSNKPSKPTKTSAPTEFPTSSLTSYPRKSPTESPTRAPVVTKSPTVGPTKFPTKSPTKYPTTVPTKKPSRAPIFTQTPTEGPTKVSSRDPTLAPTIEPTISPTLSPVTNHVPNESMSRSPSLSPTLMTVTPTTFSGSPSILPSFGPSSSPTMDDAPSSTPSEIFGFDFGNVSSSPTSTPLIASNSDVFYERVSSSSESSALNEILIQEDSLMLSSFQSQYNAGCSSNSCRRLNSIVGFSVNNVTTTILTERTCDNGVDTCFNVTTTIASYRNPTLFSMDRVDLVVLTTIFDFLDSRSVEYITGEAVPVESSSSVSLEFSGLSSDLMNDDELTQFNNVLQNFLTDVLGQNDPPYLVGSIQILSQEIVNITESSGVRRVQSVDKVMNTSTLKIDILIEAEYVGSAGSNISDFSNIVVQAFEGDGGEEFVELLDESEIGFFKPYLTTLKVKADGHSDIASTKSVTYDANDEGDSLVTILLISFAVLVVCSAVGVYVWRRRRAASAPLN